MKRRSGFTLVELVVVILILGILAGVAAPKMFNTSTKATENGLKQTLAIVRDAIEMYVAQNGALPPCTSGAAADFKLALKPYIRGPFPKCTVGPGAAQDDEVLTTTGVTTTGDAAPTTGWKFNTDTGEFICNNSGASQSVPGVTFDKF